MYTLFKRKKLLWFGALLVLGNNVWAQHQSPTLEHYIATAFAQNEGLKQQQFNLDKSLYALKEAQSMFLPTVSMIGAYTKAGGGRTIDVPVGDLVNPIYTALNELTSSTRYPQLQNQSVLLNPDNFYDVKMRTSLSLVNAEIHYNKLIKQQLISSQQAAVNVYKRTLVKDIKTAYYRYFQALKSIEVYQSALLLIAENIRENESLLRNGVRNGTALLRARTEQQKTTSLLVQARHTSYNARDYFNFLLNRPLKDSILLDSTSITTVVALPNTDAGTSRREELQQLQTLKKVHTLDYKMQKAGIIPKLNTFVDLGSQGFDFNVNDKTRYYLFGLNLQWDIFTGGQRKYKAAQSRASLNATTAQLDQTQQSLQLQLNQSYNNYESAKADFKSTVAQLALAKKYYKDQLKAYRAGQLLFLELVDAQNELTGAGLQLAAAQAGLQIALAELEREQASYPIDQTNPYYPQH